MLTQTMQSGKKGRECNGKSIVIIFTACFVLYLITRSINPDDSTYMALFKEADLANLTNDIRSDALFIVIMMATKSIGINYICFRAIIILFGGIAIYMMSRRKNINASETRAYIGVLDSIRKRVSTVPMLAKKTAIILTLGVMTWITYLTHQRSGLALILMMYLSMLICEERASRKANKLRMLKPVLAFLGVFLIHKGCGIISIGLLCVYYFTRNRDPAKDGSSMKLGIWYLFLIAGIVSITLFALQMKYQVHLLSRVNILYYACALLGLPVTLYEFAQIELSGKQGLAANIVTTYLICFMYSILIIHGILSLGIYGANLGMLSEIPRWLEISGNSGILVGRSLLIAGTLLMVLQFKYRLGWKYSANYLAIYPHFLYALALFRSYSVI